MVECTGLENRHTARYRGFESHPLCQSPAHSMWVGLWHSGVGRAPFASAASTGLNAHAVRVSRDSNHQKSGGGFLLIRME